MEEEEGGEEGGGRGRRKGEEEEEEGGECGEGSRNRREKGREGDLRERERETGGR